MTMNYIVFIQALQTKQNHIVIAIQNDPYVFLPFFLCLCKKAEFNELYEFERLVKIPLFIMPSPREKSHFTDSFKNEF